MTASTMHTADTANDTRFLAPQNNRGAVLKPIHQMTLVEFLAIAITKKLIDHGRAFEVFVGERSLGFADGPEAEALALVHRREVNNALWLFETGDVVPDPGLRSQLPSMTALRDHPELVARFPIATVKVLALEVEQATIELRQARSAFWSHTGSADSAPIDPVAAQERYAATVTRLFNQHVTSRGA